MIGVLIAVLVAALVHAYVTKVCMLFSRMASGRGGVVAGVSDRSGTL